jgi:hypothetical protein
MLGSRFEIRRIVSANEQSEIVEGARIPTAAPTGAKLKVINAISARSRRMRADSDLLSAVE